MSRSSVADKWRGQYAWQLDELPRLADVLKTTVPALMARSEGFEPPTFWSGVSPAEPTAVTAQRIAPVYAMSDYRQAVAS